MPAPPPGWTCRCSTTRRAKSIDVHIPSYGTSQNPVDSTAQGVHKIGYAEFARLVAQSPLIDGVVVVVTARRSAFLENDLPKLKDLGRESNKPVFMWTYTLPSERSVEIFNEAGYPLFTGAYGCARTHARHGRLPRFARARAQAAARRARAASRARQGARRARGRPARCCANGRRGRCSPPMASAPAARRSSRARRPKRKPPPRRSDVAVALKVQSADIPHKTEAGAVALNVAARRRARRLRARARQCQALRARARAIDGVLVQPMAPPGREVILGVNRDARWGPLLMVGLGGVHGRGHGRRGAWRRCRSTATRRWR